MCDPNQNKPGHLKFHYFSGRARGELIRWLLVLGKADWEDCRYDLCCDWPQVKSSMPMGQLPVLEGDCQGEKKMLTQSSTIIRACAHWFGFSGKTPKECIEADEAFEVLRDVMDLWALIFLEQDPARKEVMKGVLKNEVGPRCFTYLENKLKANGGKFIAGGDNFSYADITIACQINNWKLETPPPEVAQNALKYPGLFALNLRVENLPEIKAWIEKRPKTDV